MYNKPPRWNEELNAYCLNFNGRVTEASVKNFQLVTDENQGYVLLQFGKVRYSRLTLSPVSPHLTFPCCVSFRLDATPLRWTTNGPCRPSKRLRFA